MLWDTGEKCLFSLLLVVRSAQYEVKSILCAAHRELGHLSQAGGARGGGSGCLNSLSFQSGRHQWVVTWVPTGVFRHLTSLENAKQDFWFSSLGSFEAVSPESDQSFCRFIFFIVHVFVLQDRNVHVSFAWSSCVSLSKTWQSLEEVSSVLVGRRSLIWSKPCAEVCLQVN